MPVILQTEVSLYVIGDGGEAAGDPDLKTHRSFNSGGDLLWSYDSVFCFPP